MRRNLATAYGRRGNLAAKIGGRYDIAYAAQMQARRILESLLLENPLDNELRKEAAYALMERAKRLHVPGDRRRVSTSGNRLSIACER